MRALLLFVLAVFIPGPIQAREGKAFFSGDRWLKGDIEVHKDASGCEVVVIASGSGTVRVPRSQIRTIVYAPPGARTARPQARESRFLKALSLTRSSPAPARPPALYEPYIRAASRIHNLDPRLVQAVIKQESNYNRRDVSRAGARGLMQLMPGTARLLGVEDAFDPWENIHGGARYLRDMLETFDGDLEKALAAYNAGPGAVKKYGAVPPYPETRDYVRKVLGYYHAYRGARLYAFEDSRGHLVITDSPRFP